MKMVKKSYNISLESPFGAQIWKVDDKENSTVRRSLTLKAKLSLGIALVIASAILAVILVCVLLPYTRDYWLPAYTSPSVLGKFQSAAVSTDAAPCAAIGKDILQRNGSAVDATIAVLLCMGVVNPQSSGLGGGFFMIYYNRTEQAAHYIDAREVSPRNATEEMFAGNATLTRLGPLSIAVPGELVGYELAHKRFGKSAWRDLFQPTIDLCRRGIPVTAHLERALKRYEAEIRAFPLMRHIYTRNTTDELLTQGDTFKREDMAKSMEFMASVGAKALYGNTPLAKSFLQDLKNAGSVINEEDILSYKPLELPPTQVPLRDNMTLYSADLPGSGPLLAMMLHVIQGYQDMNEEVSKTRKGTVKALHRMVETFKHAYASRMNLEDDDSKEMRQLVNNLTSPEYAEYIRTRIDDTRTHDPSWYGVNVTLKDDHGTAHVSVVAPNGDAVAATSTVNQYFGSMVLSPSTGILLNDEMDDFSTPFTNYFGVPPTEKNRIRPGKRPLSSMSPAIVVDGNGDVRLVVGANGGTQITTSVAQIIVRNIFLKENVKKAIDAPRFHHQLLPHYIEYEPRFPEDILSDLKELGHDTHMLGSGMLGIVMAIAREEDGFLYANSDFRKGGTVDGF